jgi:hypothetical protein
MGIIIGREVKGKELDNLARNFGLDIQDLNKEGKTLLNVYVKLKDSITSEGIEKKAIFTGLVGEKVSDLFYLPQKGNKVEKKISIPYSELNNYSLETK